MTVREVITKSTDYLAKRGVDSPRLQIELLLSHVLRVPRLNLYLDIDRKLSEGDLERTRDLVKQRGERIPLQHLVGSMSFCGIEIRVTPDVLIPRPETELLAEMAWRFLSQISSERGAAFSPSVLDIGTGTGCLAIAIARNCSSAHLFAVDISESGLAIARDNCRTHGLESRIEFCCGDAFNAVSEGKRFDLIVSNPPYIPTNEIDSLQPEVRDYDPRMALDGGGDGLDFYRTIAAHAGRFLNPGGCVMVEFGDGQSQAVAKIFGSHNYVVEAVVPDYSSRPRILKARGNV